jgi:hypothetical protein
MEYIPTEFKLIRLETADKREIIADLVSLIIAKAEEILMTSLLQDD